MNLSLQEVDALITSLELLSNYSERQQEVDLTRYRLFRTVPKVLKITATN